MTGKPAAVGDTTPDATGIDEKPQQSELALAKRNRRHRGGRGAKSDKCGMDDRGRGSRSSNRGDHGLT
jgi:hypothetical protein